jgi:hypothetical protein
MNKIISIILSAAALGAFGCSAETGTEELTEATDDALSTSTVRLTCESNDYHYNSCGAPGERIQRARVIRQLSSVPCEEGRSWGYANNYVWVNNGCRAEFELRVEMGPQAGRIRVLDATYGGNAGASRGNATQHVARACDGRSSCDYWISVNELGDPAWGQAKDFNVRYTCSDGRPRSEYVSPEANGRRVSLSCGSSPPPPPPPSSCGVLAAGESLYQEQGVRSCNGRAYFVHQRDGNVVLYDNGRVLAATHILNSWSDVLTMQDDGNLVQYSRSGDAIWSSGTAGHRGATLSVQDDCNVVIYDRGGRAIWHTNTAGCVPEH